MASLRLRWNLYRRDRLYSTRPSSFNSRTPCFSAIVDTHAGGKQENQTLDPTKKFRLYQKQDKKKQSRRWFCEAVMKVDGNFIPYKLARYSIRG